MGQFQYSPRFMRIPRELDLDWVIGCIHVLLKYLLWEAGMNSTAIQCLYDQNFIGMCIIPIFSAPNGSPIQNLVHTNS